MWCCNHDKSENEITNNETYIRSVRYLVTAAAFNWVKASSGFNSFLTICTWRERSRLFRQVLVVGQGRAEDIVWIYPPMFDQQRNGSNDNNKAPALLSPVGTWSRPKLPGPKGCCHNAKKSRFSSSCLRPKTNSMLLAQPCNVIIAMCLLHTCVAMAAAGALNCHSARQSGECLGAMCAVPILAWKHSAKLISTWSEQARAATTKCKSRNQNEGNNSFPRSEVA